MCSIIIIIIIITTTTTFSVWEVCNSEDSI